MSGSQDGTVTSTLSLPPVQTYPFFRYSTGRIARNGDFLGWVL
jgi:hypothetical protein